MTKKKNGMSRKLRVDASVHPENYLSYNINDFAIGTVSGGSPTSVAWNDYILNAGAHIALGTGTNLRLGKHIFLTYLRLKVFIDVPYADAVRIIVGKSVEQATLCNETSNAALTAAVESEVIEAPLAGSGAVNAGHFIKPSTEYTILTDKTVGYGNPLVVFPSTSTGVGRVYVELVIPLMTQRMYNQSNVVDRGDWFIYMTSRAGTSYATGEMRLEYINQFDWEVIPRAIKGTISAADDVLTHASKSTSMKSLLALLKLL